MILDRPIRFALRLAYRALQFWWSFRPPAGEGAAVAVWHRGRLLLVRHSYRDGYELPGGGIGRKETAAIAASRELREETGVTIDPENLIPADDGARKAICRGNTAYLFEMRIGREPELRIDNREIIEARFVAPGDAESLGVAGSLRRYMAGKGVPAQH